MADHLIDIGPGAGKLGGRIVAQGSQKDLMASADSLTGRYLREPMQHGSQARRPSADHWLQVAGAQLHNLKNLNVRIPLERLTVVTGATM